MAFPKITRREFVLMGGAALVTGAAVYGATQLGQSRPVSPAPTVPYQPQATPADTEPSFDNYIDFGDKGARIETLPDLLEGKQVKALGWFTPRWTYIVSPLRENKARMIINNLNPTPAGYNPDNIAGYGVLTFEPAGFDSVEQIKGTMICRLKKGQTYTVSGLDLNCVRYWNLYKDADIAVKLKQKDGSYKYVGRVA